MTLKTKGPPRIFAACVFWALTALCAAVIFKLSSQSAGESSMLSDEVQSFLGSLIGKIFEIHFIRKSAHFLEYCGFAFLLFYALYFSFGYFKPFLTVGLTAFYAATDEIHQLFVDGRACRFTDICIDTSGAVLTVITLALIIEIICRIRQRRNAHENL